MKVIVTGTGRGIGRAIAMKFLSSGHDVTGIDVNPSTIDDERYTHIISDISDGELPEIGDVEILINNAGVQDTGRDIDVNLKGTIRVTEKYAFNNGIKSVLFIASAGAATGAEFPEYVASKGGVVSYMKNVALRLARQGVTVNSLSPGGVLTPLNARVIDDEDNGAYSVKEVGERGGNSRMGVFSYRDKQIDDRAGSADRQRRSGACGIYMVAVW